jgi:hypothetical protein
MIDLPCTHDTSRREERLVDEAIRDSFPASDPSSVAQPGSIVNRRYARAADFHSDATLLSALSLAPLVAVAWAEAGLDDVEADMVRSWAEESGLTRGDAGYALLEHWLSGPPYPELMACWREQYVGRLSRSLSREAQRELKHHILSRATALVEATGAFSGVGQSPSPNELVVIRDIERAFS